MIQLHQIIYLPRLSRLSHYFKSRMRSSDIDPESVEIIMRKYGYEIIRSPANLPLSRRSRNVVVDTSHGLKVLKCYRARHSTENIIYSHSILEFLEQSGFSAPRLSTTPSGENYVIHSGDHYALFDFIEGTNYSLNYFIRAHRLKLMSLAGQTLGRLHQSLNGFMPRGKHYLGFSSYTGGWQRDQSWFGEKVVELKEKSEELHNSEDQIHGLWLCEHADSVLEEYKQMDDTFRSLSLPRVVIHGDFGLHNIVFQKDGTIVPIDFESSRLEWRLCDLVSCLSRLRFSNRLFDFESMKYFMEGYKKESKISADEWGFMPQIWRFYRLRSAMIYWNSYFETNGPTRKLISARNAVIQADWAKSNPNQILDILFNHIT